MSPSQLARIVKIVNFLIAAIVVAALAVVYWCVWRPLPRHSGSIEAGVAAPVVVRFDAHGVPHIEASSLEDALFVQGYVTAQDRLWQMDALRIPPNRACCDSCSPASLRRVIQESLIPGKPEALAISQVCAVPAPRAN